MSLRQGSKYGKFRSFGNQQAPTSLVHIYIPLLYQEGRPSPKIGCHYHNILWKVIISYIYVIMGAISPN